MTEQPGTTEETYADAADAEATDTPVADALEDAAAVHELADEAADVMIEEASQEATELAAGGDDEGAEEVLAEAAVEVAVIEETADELGLEIVETAAAPPSVIEDTPASPDEPEEDDLGTADVVIAEDPAPAEVEDAVSVEDTAPVKDTAPAEDAVPAEDTAPGGDDPFKGPGDWYVVHTYAGYENKVKANLESRIHTMQMEDKIFRVHIPMEDVMEIKGGKKQVVQKKVFPGYLLVKMWYDNDSWYVVRNTPGVTGFVAAGTGSKPTPLSKREIEKILVIKKEEAKPAVRLGFEEGDVVRIISGPFADFNGTINEINPDQAKLKVLVNIFDRETPVELAFDQVAKV